MKRLQFIDVQQIPSSPNGAVTYRNDFMKVVYPEISKHFKIVESDPDLYLSIDSPTIEDPNKPIVWINHMNQFVCSPRPTYKKQIAIIHNKCVEEEFKNNIPYQFINMSVDVKSVPKTSKKIKDRWLYVGNIRHDDGKEETLNELKRYIDFDVISFGRFNGGDQMSHQETLDIISTYQYGLGAGRVTLEMLASGLKCLVVGFRYGGPILNNSYLIKHLAYNCNATVSTVSENTFYDINLLKNALTIDLDLIDMSKKTSEYIAVLNRALYL